MAARESIIQARIRDRLNAIEGVACQVHHATWGTDRGHSDLYGSARGRAFYFEVKPPGVKPEPHQLRWLKRVRQSGAICGVVHGPDEAVDLLASALDEETP